jgi:hypothetical protein
MSENNVFVENKKRATVLPKKRKPIEKEEYTCRKKSRDVLSELDESETELSYQFKNCLILTKEGKISKSLIHYKEIKETSPINITKEGKISKSLIHHKEKKETIPIADTKDFKDPDKQLQADFYSYINKKTASNKKNKQIIDICNIDSAKTPMISFESLLEFSNCDWNTFIDFENHEVHKSFMTNECYPDENRLLKILIVDLMRKQRDMEQRIENLEKNLQK